MDVPKQITGVFSWYCMVVAWAQKFDDQRNIKKKWWNIEPQ